MSDVQRDKQFYDMADAYIALANAQLSDAKPSRVSAAALFAASRFNAFVIRGSGQQGTDGRREGSRNRLFSGSVRKDAAREHRRASRAL
jgi:hypothetical protein